MHLSIVVAIAQLVEHQVSDREAADLWFDSQMCYCVLKKDILCLFPIGAKHTIELQNRTQKSVLRCCG